MAPFVLVVEDDLLVADMTCRILELGGFLAKHVSSAEEALASNSVRSGLVDLFVIDLILPHATGLKLAEQLPHRSPRAPIIFVSGHPGTLDPSESLDCEFLWKPYTPDELLGAARRLLHLADHREA